MSVEQSPFHKLLLLMVRGTGNKRFLPVLPARKEPWIKMMSLVNGVCKPLRVSSSLYVRFHFYSQSQRVFSCLLPLIVLTWSSSPVNNENNSTVNWILEQS